MSFYSTRYGRFVERQRRYVRRRKRKWVQGRPATVGHPEYGHGATKWSWFEGGKQLPAMVSSEGKTPLITSTWPPFGTPYHITEATGKMPPHVVIDSLAYQVAYAAGSHARGALVGFHVRRAKWIGKKVGRMNGFQRKIYFANLHGRDQGYFPDWDPLMRHPTESDIDGGADSIVGDAWKVPGIWPTGT